MLIDGLISAAKSRRLILFAGAGLSAGLGLPTWNQLIDKLASDLGYDPRIFRTFGDAETLAEFYHLEKRTLGPLRSWMDTTWHATTIDIGRSAVHRLIVQLDFPVIYTTNFDRWIERAYDHYGRAYTKVLKVEDLAAAIVRPEATQIVKFHGDFDSDDTLVLTESHFLRRLELESPLDVRLRADLFGRSVLFIGYSLTDPNIRRLLFRLRTTWEAAGLASDQPPSFIFAARPNAVQERVFQSWGVHTVSEDEDDPSLALEAFLGKLVDGRGP